MKKLLKLTAVMLIVAGAFACKKENDIDFSNIENLYAQPLPVIQKAVQGKWKVYEITTYGIINNVGYPENMYCEFSNNHYIVSNNEERSTYYFTWKKMQIQNWITPHVGEETYVMYEGSQIIGNWFFLSIQNDTLNLNTCMGPAGMRAVKVK
jgi:hypothetical protein